MARRPLAGGWSEPAGRQPAPLPLLFWYACRVRHPARPRWRAFLMALAVLAALPATYAAGIHYIITVRDGSPFILLPVALSFPFVLRALIRGWLRRPPRERPTGGSDPGRAGLDRPGGSRRLLTAIRP